MRRIEASQVVRRTRAEAFWEEKFESGAKE